MTSPKRWARVEALFDAAVVLPAAARGAFLRAKCGDDQALLDDVTTLLEADTGLGAGDLIRDTVAGAAAQLRRC